MHIHTLHEVCKLVERLMRDYNIGLGKAVNHVASTYGYTEDQVYKYMTVHNIAGQGHSDKW